MRQSTRCVLVVDDDPGVRECMERALEPMAQVTSARDAVQALQLMRTRHFDVIVSDYSMPGMDGVTFLGCAAKLAPDCRRVLSSGEAPPTMPTLVETGAIHSYLEKPWSMKELLATVIDPSTRH